MFNASIIINSIKLKSEEIVKKIIELDESLNFNLVEKVVQLIPIDEEVKKLKEFDGD